MYVVVTVCLLKLVLWICNFDLECFNSSHHHPLSLLSHLLPFSPSSPLPPFIFPSSSSLFLFPSMLFTSSNQLCNESLLQQRQRLCISVWSLLLSHHIHLHCCVAETRTVASCGACSAGGLMTHWGRGGGRPWWRGGGRSWGRGGGVRGTYLDGFHLTMHNIDYPTQADLVSLNVVLVNMHACCMSVCSLCFHVHFIFCHSKCGVQCTYVRMYVCTSIHA